MTIGTMDPTPLLCISRAVEWSLHLLLYGLLLSIPVISAISVIPVTSTIGRVDFQIILVLL
jgi:hypothetical protein